MTPLIIVAALAGVPLLLALVLRVSAIYLFLSLLVGDVLVRYQGDTVTLVMSTLIRDFHSDFAVDLVLLLLPVALTIIFLRKSVSRPKLVLHIVPLIATGLAVVALAVPLLPGGIRYQIMSTPAGNALNNADELVLPVAGLLVLLLAWLTGRHKKEGKHDKHHK